MLRLWLLTVAVGRLLPYVGVSVIARPPSGAGADSCTVRSAAMPSRASALRNGAKVAARVTVTV